MEVLYPSVNNILPKAKLFLWRSAWNVDAAVNAKDDRIGVGVVARDDKRVILLTASKTLWPFILVERVEIDAFQWALEIVKEKQWSRVIMEGDDLNVIQAHQGKLSRGIHN